MNLVLVAGVGKYPQYMSVDNNIDAPLLGVEHSDV